MRFGYSSISAPELDFDGLAAAAKRNGFEAIEVRLDKENTVLGLSDGALADAAERARKVGVTVSDLGSGISVAKYDEALLPVFEKCARQSSIVGAKAFRVFLGSFVSSRDHLPVKDIDGIAKMLSEGAEIAAKYGVEVWVETHSDFSTAESVDPVLRKITGKGTVRVIWDVLHSVEWGEDPAESLRILGNRIAHVHIKDGVKNPDPARVHYQLTKLGEGTAPIEEVVRLLKSVGYDGIWSLEWEKMWHPELAACYADADELLSVYRGWMLGLELAAR